METFADTAWASADLASPVRVRRERPASDSYRRLALDLETRGFALHRRIAHPGLPIVDHLVVGASGVWVVAREPVHCARVSVRHRFTARPSLRIGNRDRTALVDDLDRNLTAVRGLLFDQLDVPVQAALCLPGAEFPLLRTLSVGDHLVLRPAQLLDHLARRGPVKRSRARVVAEVLDERLG